jgi:PAS fold
MLNPTPEEQRWLAAIEGGRLGTWDLDPRLEVVHYAPQWKSRLGFPRIHDCDSTGFWRCRVHPEDFDAMLRSLRLHIDGSLPTYEVRFRLRSNGSGYRYVLSRGRVVERDANGAATRMVGTMVDLTDRPPVAAAHGLAAEDPTQVVERSRVPFHALLGVNASQASGPSSGWPSSPGLAADRHRLVDQVHDLLHRAWRDAGGGA